MYYLHVCLGSKRARKRLVPFDYDDLEWEHAWYSKTSRSADISEVVDRNMPDVEEPHTNRSDVDDIPTLLLKRNTTSSSFRVVSPRTHKRSTKSDDGVYDVSTEHNLALFGKTTLSADDVSLGIPFTGPITELSIGDDPCSIYSCSSVESIHSAESSALSEDSMPMSERRFLNDILCDDVTDDGRDSPMIGPQREPTNPEVLSEDGTVTPPLVDRPLPNTPVTPATDTDYDSNESIIV